MMRRRTKQTGFTLLEVVIAMVIFVLTLPSLIVLVELGMTRAEETRNLSLGSLKCRSKLAEITIGAESSDAGGWTAFGTETNWYWRVETTSPGVDNVKTVQVWAKFDAGQGGQTYETTITQMILDPSFRGSTQDRSLIVPPTTSTGGGQ